LPPRSLRRQLLPPVFPFATLCGLRIERLMRRFCHTHSSAKDRPKSATRVADNAASRNDSITRADQLLNNCSGFEIIVAHAERDRSNPYFPGTKCISSCCRRRLRSRRESILAELRHQAGRSTSGTQSRAVRPDPTRRVGVSRCVANASATGFRPCL
jgi:hypothetical protein